MEYRSIFDIIGPIMIGPSSSHTAGATRIGRAARSLLKGEPTWLEIRLYGSFAKTYRGHGTDVAVVGGILGFSPSNPQIPRALEIAREIHTDVRIMTDASYSEHPNTARVRLGNHEEEIELLAASIGGGNIEILELNGFQVKLTSSSALMIFHLDRPGVIAGVANLLASRGINIARMAVSRREIGGEALMIIELDQPMTAPILNELALAPFVSRAAQMEC
ncbi:MAG: L-serine ammonia-lyase, iron-sulfur-dependent subunit beta [Bacteroidetes bacterium]|nr:L-serine ammonia-lyase, iron-sulfur-dependent subunit beta [Bacteroidota bacterium]